MSVTESGYAIINNSQAYFTGFGNNFDKQFRAARIYHSIKYAKEAKDHLCKRGNNSILKLAKVDIIATIEYLED